MASGRASHMMRDQWRATENYRDRKGQTDTVTREPRQRSRTRSRSVERRAPAADRDARPKLRNNDVHTNSSKRSKHEDRPRSRDRDRSRERRKPDLFNSPNSPPRSRKAIPTRSHHQTDTGRKFHLDHRQEGSTSGKRRRSRSTSRDRDHRRKSRRTSPSPHRSEKPHFRSSDQRTKRRDRSESIGRGRDHPSSTTLRTDDRYYIPSERRRSKSPPAREEKISKHRGRSQERQEPRSKRDFSHSRSPLPTATSTRRSNSPKSNQNNWSRTHKEKPLRRNDSPENQFERTSHPKNRRSSPISRRRGSDTAESRRYHPSTQHPKTSRKSQKSRVLSPRREPGHKISIENSKLYKGKSERSPRRSRSPSKRSETVVETTEMDFGNQNAPPSPPRPIPSFSDSDDRSPSGDGRMRDAYPMHGMKSGNFHSNRSTPQIDTRQNYSHSPPHMTPNSAHQLSPQAQSPYGAGRGWGGQQQQFHSPHGPQMHQYPQQPYRQNSYPPPGHQGQFYPNQHHQNGQFGGPHHMQQGFQGHFRGNQNFRGNQFTPVQDRRFSGPGGQQYGMSHRGNRGHFSNLQWTANGRGRGGGNFEANQHQMQQANHSSPPTAPPPQPNGSMDDSEDNPFRPSKDLQVEDESSKNDDKSDTSNVPMGSDTRHTPTGPQDKAGQNKFSFAFKSKPAPPTKPDLSKKMREPPRKEISVNLEYAKGKRVNVSGRHEKITEKRIMKRIKPRPTLSAEFASSDSVYFRNPGNESVIGSGTYGKVYKAIHVYTKAKVALKKIRMEGERDGFPVTAVREIKLLQSLKHHNVVDLQEVMVEKNDCYMVFEYLSHDLTGLLNHPTFKLEHAHKKHLAKQLFEGLDYLHRRGVLHRDIKAANILVSNEGQLKLADFGLARFYAKRRQLDYTNRVITIWYRSPELLLGETQYGPAVDIWSAACVLVEIFTRHAIFPGDGGEINQLDKIYNILGTPTRAEWPGLTDMAWFELLRPTELKQNVFAEKYKERVTPAAFELLASMFQYDPARRPSAEEVLSHEYFTVEEPLPRQATELRDLEGDWHEFESKALRKENERRDKEARRATRQEEHAREKEKEKEREKRRISAVEEPAGEGEGTDGDGTERDAKRVMITKSDGDGEMGPDGGSVAAVEEREDVVVRDTRDTAVAEQEDVVMAQ